VSVSKQVKKIKLINLSTFIFSDPKSSTFSHNVLTTTQSSVEERRLRKVVFDAVTYPPLHEVYLSTTTTTEKPRLLTEVPHLLRTRRPSYSTEERIFNAESLTNPSVTVSRIIRKDGRFILVNVDDSSSDLET